MKRIVYFIVFSLSVITLTAQETLIQYLSGTDKDHTVTWDFYCTKGARSGKWTTIPVPSNWELQGFGGYNYGHDKNKHDEQGWYKTHFVANAAWKKKQIELVFEGVMTDAAIKINGQSVGAIHQGGFYQFSYNITPLIKFGSDNLLEVTVAKMSADSTVNKAEREGDFWVFGGIYRPVYLRILPQTFIERVAIDAKANGNFTMDVFTENTNSGDEIVAQVYNTKGEKFGEPFMAEANKSEAKINLSKNFLNPQCWNPELPRLYNITVSIRRKNKIIHTIRQRFGFRTVVVRPNDGIYVNNTKVILKGVNRHSAWPESGRTLSRQIHLMDINLIKDMNMNAVRMSHYPPDPLFLDLCDSLGLFVLDELTGWQKKYATPIGKKLVKELVIRDVNHPSILFWDNGNEGGFNFDLDDQFALYDPQNRVVLHPWAIFNHIDSKHYPEYSYVEKAAEKNNILLHTEMIHGLYDGGHGAGLEDYWKLMRSNPRHAGGFLWVLADEGVVRKDKHDSIDTYGNNAPDGIVGPHREKEASFYTVKEIWSPVQVAAPELDQHFSGTLEIKNDYHYTDLSACSFSWQLIRYPLAKEKKTGHTVIHTDKLVLTAAPGTKIHPQLKLPENWYTADAIVFRAVDRFGRLLNEWTWPIKNPATLSRQNLGKLQSAHTAITEKEEGEIYSVMQDGIRYDFNSVDGKLHTVSRNQTVFPIGDGPVLAGEKQTLQRFRHYRDAQNNLVVTASYSGHNLLTVDWVFSNGAPVKLNYSYTQKDSAYFSGISFDMNEAVVTGVKWLGSGPYRVWKNRLKGTHVDVWYKKYNNTITGETFDYPEFKGYHANLYWAVIENKTAPFTVYTENTGTYLQLFHPEKQKSKFIPFVNPPFPDGNLGFMHAIPAIGTKFKGAETMGPQSQKNPPANSVIEGTLWFDFR